MSLVIVAADNSNATMVGDSGHWNDAGDLAHLATKICRAPGNTLFGWLGRGGTSNREAIEQAAHGITEMKFDVAGQVLQRYAELISKRIYAWRKSEVNGQAIMVGFNAMTWVRTLQFIYDPKNPLMYSPLLCVHKVYFPQRTTLYAMGRDATFQAEKDKADSPVDGACGWATAAYLMQKSVEAGEKVSAPFHLLTLEKS